MNHTDFFCMMLGGAINAVFAGESHAVQWISNPCANGEVFSMKCLDEERWRRPWKHGQVTEAVGGSRASMGMVSEAGSR